jgi:hypothetical protein
MGRKSPVYVDEARCARLGPRDDSAQEIRDAFVRIEHGANDAAQRAFLRPDYDALRLLLPVVAQIARNDAVRIFVRVLPSRDDLKFAGFVDDPVPRDELLLACFLEQAIDPLHLRFFH